MKPESFYRRAHESRARLTKENGLDEDPELFNKLRSTALEIQHGHIEEVTVASTPIELGRIVDRISVEIQESFPNDAYGEKARTYFLKRVFEKTRDEVGDWLIEEGREDLREQLTIVADTWSSAEEAGTWIAEHVLAAFDDKSLFQRARDAKIEESEIFYRSQKAT